MKYKKTNHLCLIIRSKKQILVKKKQQKSNEQIK